jgi:4-carboxymuconolactone decarboxylase
LPRDLRELVILRTAQLAGTSYEWTHHYPIAREFGVPDEKLSDLLRWRSSGEFDERERLGLQLADEMHNISVSDQTFGDLKRIFTPGEIVELLSTIGFYQGCSRVMQALGVDVEPEFQRYAFDRFSRMPTE